MTRDSVTGSTTIEQQQPHSSPRRSRGGDMSPTGGSKPHNRRENLITLLSSAASAASSFLSSNDLLLLPSQTLTLDSLISSTTSSISLPPPPPHHHLQSWFRRFLAASSGPDSDLRWTTAFRMSKPSFSSLLRLLSSGLASSLPSSIAPDLALAAALYRLAHAAPYAAVASRFGLEPEAACQAFYIVCKVVNEELGNLFEFQSDVDRVLVGFGWVSLPNCCGVLGFGRFGVSGQVLGRNGAVMVQALVDSEGRFLDVSAGWPSTLKPETILRQTKLFLEVEEEPRELFNGAPYQLWNGSSVPQYVLGDSCFPLLPWLLTPYAKRSEEDGLSFSKTEFNAAHSRAMRLVDTAFARVRARWQLLSKQWKEESLEFLPFVIVTGCLLHNFLMESNEPLPDENVEDDKEELPPFIGEMDEDGQRIRDALALHLAKVSLRR